MDEWYNTLQAFPQDYKMTWRWTIYKNGKGLWRRQGMAGRMQWWGVIQLQVWCL